MCWWQRECDQASLVQKAGENLASVDREWLGRLITRLEKPEFFKQALERRPDDIKVVIQFPEI